MHDIQPSFAVLHAARALSGGRRTEKQRACGRYLEPCVTPIARKNVRRSHDGHNLFNIIEMESKYISRAYEDKADEKAKDSNAGRKSKKRAITKYEEDTESFDMKIVALVTIFAPNKDKQASVCVTNVSPRQIGTRERTLTFQVGRNSRVFVRAHYQVCCLCHVHGRTARVPDRQAVTGGYARHSTQTVQAHSIRLHHLHPSSCFRPRFPPIRDQDGAVGAAVVPARAVESPG
jgi:hypothetical protein